MELQIELKLNGLYKRTRISIQVVWLTCAVKLPPMRSLLLVLLLLSWLFILPLSTSSTFGCKQEPEAFHENAPFTKGLKDGTARMRQCENSLMLREDDYGNVDPAPYANPGGSGAPIPHAWSLWLFLPLLAFLCICIEPSPPYCFSTKIIHKNRIITSSK